MTEPVLQARALARSFKEGSTVLQVLDGAELVVGAGERIAIVGASGSGKTTMLQVLGGLDKPDAGSVQVAGRDIPRPFGARALRAAQSQPRIHLPVPSPAAGISALENVAMPLLIRRLSAREATERATRVLERVGLAARLRHRPHQLSGGERQRAAVARALVTEPLLVLADEPTGNLDGANAAQVFELMLELNRERGTSLVVVTHDTRLAARMDRVLVLQDGKLHEQAANSP